MASADRPAMKTCLLRWLAALLLAVLSPLGWAQGDAARGADGLLAVPPTVDFGRPATPGAPAAPAAPAAPSAPATGTTTR